MSKASSAYELSLGPRAAGEALTAWLYAELRRAILDGRLVAGTRLPPTREFAAQQGISRGTVVSVFERLESEGYLSGRVGSGTTVNRLTTATRARAVGRRHRAPSGRNRSTCRASIHE